MSYGCSIDEEKISKTFLSPYNLQDIDPAPIKKSINHANDRDSMSNEYPQTTTHQPGAHSYPKFASLRTMEGKKKGFRISFALFRRNYLLEGRVNETVATI